MLVKSSLVFLFCFAFVYGTVFETVYTSTLSPNQVVGLYISGANERSVGISVCHVSRYTSPPEVTCRIQHNVDELRSAGLMQGSVGSNGILIQDIDISRGFELLVTLSLSDTELLSLLNGEWYIELGSLDFPDGEIRGQIQHTDRFYSSLSSRNTIPHASGTDASGLAVAKYSSSERTLSFSLVHDVTQSLTTEVRSGSIGAVGPLEASLSGASPLYSDFAMTRFEDESLLETMLYLNVISVSNSQGDIRGQFVSIDYLTDVAFSSALSGENADTSSDALGAAVVTYNCATGIMEYIVIHSITDATSGIIFEGESPSELNSILFSLPSGQSPIYGAVQLLPDEERALYSADLFFSIQSEAFSSGTGEISGTIDNEFLIVSYLSGTNVVPPLSTSHAGLMLLQEREDDDDFNYILLHDVSDVLEINLMRGTEGENTDRFLLSLPSVVSPATGSISIGDVNSVLDGSTYFELNTREHPLGIIRGQTQVLGACSVERDFSIPYTSIEESTFGQLQSSETFVRTYLSPDDGDSFNVNIEIINSASTLTMSVAFVVTLFFAHILFIFQ